MELSRSPCWFVMSVWEDNGEGREEVVFWFVGFGTAQGDFVG